MTIGNSLTKLSGMLTLLATRVLVKKVGDRLTLIFTDDWKPKINDVVQATAYVLLCVVVAITQSDYYGMQAIFAGVQHADRELPLSAETKQRIAAVDAEIESLTTWLEKFLPHSTDAVIAIDDADAEHLIEPRGQASGLISPTPDLSRGGYTWWSNQTGQDVLRYSPGVRGRYRIW